VDAWREALLNPALDKRPHFLGKIRLGSGRAEQAYTAIGHHVGGMVILELESDSPDANSSFDRLYPGLQDFMLRLEEIRSTEELSRYTAASVRQLTGFDRALIYQFDDDWNGAVIA
jgi:light-regulated signal transduction histidine kinase (bacteriophytochrome)